MTKTELGVNTEGQFLLRNGGEEEFDEGENQDIIDRIDREYPNPNGFANIDEFVEFNKRRTELINKAIEEAKNVSKKPKKISEKNDEKEVGKGKGAHKNDKTELLDASERFLNISVSNKEIENVQRRFKDLLEKCLKVADHIKKSRTQN